MSAASGGFAPQWQDPTHADSFWFRDAMHFPAPVTPLNATFFQPAFTRGASAAISRLSMPVTGLTIGVHHGYVYMNPVPFQGDEATTQARFAEMQRLTMELGATNLRDWYDTFEPRVLAIAHEAAGFDFAAAPTAAIARHLAGLYDRTVEVWDIHMRVNIPTMNAVFGLEEMIQHTLGEAALADSRALLQGFENKSSALGQALWDLAEWVRAQPSLAAAVQSANVRGGRVVLPPHPQAAEFVARLQDFLSFWGWRSDVFAEFGHPSWREDPSTALTQLKGFLANPTMSPAARQAEERARRETLQRDLEARLPEQARPVFHALLPLAQQYLPISEDHNFTIDQKFTVVTREAFQHLGRRLAAEGLLADAEDVFYLTFDEVGALAEGRGAEALAAATARRRRDRASQVRMQPPPFIGTPPPADQPIDPLAAKFFGLGIRPSEDPKVIVGHAASPGSVTGIARVIRSLDQAGKLTPGDILVCQMTMPAWTPLFAQAGGVVADTGGALSHCAIVAREYGLPCVAGTMIGTRTIPDGARIHVDGSSGMVRILE
jgi:pyruvate,water dikinase